MYNKKNSCHYCLLCICEVVHPFHIIFNLSFKNEPRMENYTHDLTNRTSMLVLGVKLWSMDPTHKTFSGLSNSKPHPWWTIKQGWPYPWGHVSSLGVSDSHFSGQETVFVLTSHLLFRYNSWLYPLNCKTGEHELFLYFQFSYNMNLRSRNETLKKCI